MYISDDKSQLQVFRSSIFVPQKKKQYINYVLQLNSTIGLLNYKKNFVNKNTKNFLLIISIDI